MNLKSKFIFDTGPISCDGLSRSLWWKNTLGDIKICIAYVWTGCTTGFKGDVDGRMIYQGTAGKPHIDTMMVLNQWDHYTEPTGPNHEAIMNFSPNWIEVPNGHYLRMNFFASYNDPVKYKQHHTGYIWYHF